MTGFDNLMRSQQMVQSDQQFYDQQRYQSDMSMRNTLAQVPQQAVSTALAIRQANSSLRLQEAETAHQLQVNKIQMMGMVDQLDLSRQAVKAGNLDLDMRAFDFKRAQEEYERSKGSYADERTMSFFKGIGGFEGLAAAGKIGEIVDGKVSWRDPKDEAELESFREGIIKSRGRPSEDRLTRAEDRRQSDADRALAKERLDYLTMNNGTDKEIAAAQQDYARMLGGGAPAAQTAAPPPTLAQQPQDIQNLVSQFNIPWNIGPSGQTMPLYDERTATKIAQSLAKYRDRISKSVRSGAAKGRDYESDEAAFQDVLNVLRNPNHPLYQQTLMVLTAGNQ